MRFLVIGLAMVLAGPALADDEALQRQQIELLKQQNEALKQSLEGQKCLMAKLAEPNPNDVVTARKRLLERFGPETSPEVLNDLARKAAKNKLIFEACPG